MKSVVMSVDVSLRSEKRISVHYSGVKPKSANPVTVSMGLIRVNELLSWGLVYLCEVGQKICICKSRNTLYNNH